MRKSFLIIALLISLQAAAYAGAKITLTSSPANPQPNSDITLTATAVPNVSEVSFYNGSALLGTVTCSGAPTCANFVYVWRSVPAGSYADVFAVAGTLSNNSSNTTSNGPIDRFEDPGLLVSPLNAPNPAVGLPTGNSSKFGYNQSGAWAPGDNQVCSITWPYNGMDSNFPDGTCAWTGSTTAPGSQSISIFTPGNTPPASTKDSLDDTMHTMSDFLVFANTLLNRSITTLSGDLSSWYPQAATWIAPSCSNSNVTGCNPGTLDGRLYSLSNQRVLNNWVNVMNPWMNNIYMPSGATSAGAPGSNSTVWCVPQESSLLNGNSHTSEDDFIKANSSSTGQWGDLSHVVACLNYNAGPSQAEMQDAQYIKFSNCLSALNTANPSMCPANPGDQYLPMSCQLAVSSCVNSQCIAGQCLDGSGACTNSIHQYQGDGNDCNINYVYPSGVPSFANWINSQINFGAVNNYQSCVNLLSAQGGHCSSNPPALCSTSILGRSLVNSTTEPMPKNWDSNSCSLTPPSCQPGNTCDLTGGTCSNGTVCSASNPCNTGVCTPYGNGKGVCTNDEKTACNLTFMQWAQDSLTLAQDEQPKFALRYAFLNDIYTRAKTMQSIFQQGNTTLTSFFCQPGDANCPAAGGPAYQLMKAKTIKPPVEVLPNAIIYGWRDATLPNGDRIPAGRPGAGFGYAHVVKVTAFAPGRDGNLTGVVGGDFVNTRLPWISTHSDWDSRTYKLDPTDRDGYVYVSVKRWDEDQNTPVNFPNNHALWNFSYSNPSKAKNQSVTAANLENDCFQGYSSGILNPIGLTDDEATGLRSVLGSTSKDGSLMKYAFMLNDNAGNSQVGGPNVDPNNGKPHYAPCLSDADALVDRGIESHACVRYVAARSANGSSGDGDHDYSLEFVTCDSKIPRYTGPPNDLGS